jgi:two-component system, OmpR family, phosphate regulon sensor histidine kinase PhoR
MSKRAAHPRFLRRFYPGVHARLIVPFLVVSVVIAGIGVFIVTRLVAGSVQERFSNQLLDSAHAAANAVAEIERQQLATLRVMVFTEGVAAELAEGGTAVLDLWLRPLAANAAVDELIVFNRQGQSVLRLEQIPSEVGAAYRQTPAVNIAHWHGIRRLLNQELDAQGDKYVDLVNEPGAQRRVFFSAPVPDSAGGLAGGTTIGMNLETFVQRVSEQSLSAVALYSAQGEVLGHSFRMIDDADLHLPDAQIAALLAAVQTTGPIEELTLGGVPYQMLFAPFTLRGESVGLLAVGLPSNFIVEQSSTSRDIFGALFAVLFMAVGILGMLMARTITRPVEKLVDTTRAIRGGDLSRRVNLKTPDELGELGRSFDHMTNQLVHQNRKINALYLQQLEETTRRDAVLGSIGDAVVVLNTSGEIFLRNHAAQKLIDQTASDPPLRRRFRLLLRNPDMIRNPRTVEIGSGYFSVISRPVHLPGGDLLGHVIVFRDITPLVQAEKLKDDLMMQMSHELRTPLTAARGYLDLVKMLESASLSEQGITHLEGAHEYLGALERLIGQVEDVTAIQANRFRLEKDRCNLTHVLIAQAEAWRRLVPQRQLTLTLYAPQSDICVEGDERRLGQLFDHLLRNAYSYTLPGGSIEIQVAVRAESIIVYVLDTGVGIEPDERERVFERMYRGRSAEAGPTDSSGLGLGLYLAQHIAAAHGGSITLDSKPGTGTIVMVELPVTEVVERSAESVGAEAQVP